MQRLAVICALLVSGGSVISAQPVTVDGGLAVQNDFRHSRDRQLYAIGPAVGVSIPLPGTFRFTLLQQIAVFPTRHGSSSSEELDPNSDLADARSLIIGTTVVERFAAPRSPPRALAIWQLGMASAWRTPREGRRITPILGLGFLRGSVKVTLQCGLAVGLTNCVMPVVLTTKRLVYN